MSTEENGQLSELEQALERLTEFLYVVPIALLRFDEQGQVLMANPGFTQIFNTFTETGMVTNIFDLLESQASDLIVKIKAFEGHGTVCDNERIHLQQPFGPKEEIVLDVRVMKEHNGNFVASLNNVTEQYKISRKNMINDQRLTAIFKHIDDYGIFSLDEHGYINHWNNSVRNFTHLTESQVLGMHFSSFFDLTKTEGKSLLDIAKRSGWVAFNNPNNYPANQEGDTVLSLIKNEFGQVLGFTVISRHHFGKESISAAG